MRCKKFFVSCTCKHQSCTTALCVRCCCFFLKKSVESSMMNALAHSLRTISIKFKFEKPNYKNKMMILSPNDTTYNNNSLREEKVSRSVVTYTQTSVFSFICLTYQSSSSSSSLMTIKTMYINFRRIVLKKQTLLYN